MDHLAPQDPSPSDIEHKIIELEQKITAVEKKLQNPLTRVDPSPSDIEHKIIELEQKITAVEKKLQNPLTRETYETEAYLVDEKKQLRDKEKQLRDEKKLLLQLQLKSAVQPSQDPLTELAARVPGPSSYAMPTVFKFRTHICLHRPEYHSHIPVAALIPEFGQFTADLSTETDFTPARKEVNFVMEFTVAMAKIYQSESERVQIVNCLLGMYLTGAPLSGVVFSGMIAISDASLFQQHALLLNLEIKNERHSGNVDAFCQNAAYYLKHWGQGNLKPLREKSYCPTFLVDICGPYLSVAGAVIFKDKVYVDPLGPTWPLLIDPGTPSNLSHFLRLFKALKVGIDSLRQFYSENHQTKVFHGVRLEQSLSRFTFSGSMEENSVVAKFCHQFIGRAAQEYAASLGLAPAIKQLIPLPGPNGAKWSLVVMDRLELAEEEEEFSEAQKQEFKSKMQLFHNEGFVHGDLRACNIRINKGKLVLLDFEWAGRVADHPRYPCSINMELSWPNGVEPNGHIQAAHDKEWLTRL
eukprot:NODE_1000_length_1718_cov_283.834695_g938_i1.p1 GENE.NODE_1000_length_1718_cov_283.834695_g938_i1~~NODE_1000_length_1718_cov_283.834695_g938_i1.p1  ORF type:complete len:525 (-),score=106.27 NODE_1000_length_1718_cov_283.834695_g938_i1:57-1631(-)